MNQADALMQSIQELPDGTYEVAFRTPFVFGQMIRYRSTNGTGRGRIVDMVVVEDGSVYYSVELPSGEIQPGIYPEEVLHAEPV
jgi:hypothetical protein